MSVYLLRTIAVASLLWATAASAFEPFVIRDIRVEGLQRTEAGTVFSYLPLRVGDRAEPDRVASALKALYATGFFKDVRIDAERDVLVVSVVERPAIARVTINGAKEFTADDLKKGLKQIGLAESRIFDRSLLEKADQELKRQYLGRGKYSAKVTTTVTPLERNRVGINIDIDEGEAAKIRRIRVLGATAYPEQELVELFTLRTPGLFTWFTRNDQYSRQKLNGDLETLKSFYFERGYAEFAVDSTQVQISPDKQAVYITVSITEGDRFKIGEIKVAGDLVVPENELRGLLKIKPGDVFSRDRITDSSKAIGDRLGSEGYAFANANITPDIDHNARLVALNVLVDPGKRVYVRRINVAGNTRTRDEVVRRELRQMESAWYDSRKIELSKQRVDRLGYFSEVSVETPPVQGSADLVDLNINVTERPTGNILLGAGVSSSEGFVVQGSISQQNLFGTGKSLTAQVNSGDINRVYALSFTDPYWTVDGVSRGFDVYQRNLDSTSLVVGTYKSSTVGGGIRFGLPIAEFDTLTFGLAIEDTTIETNRESPRRYLEFVDTFGSKNSTLLGSLSWARDSRNSAFFPTDGALRRMTIESGLPGGDLKYYKASYLHQWFYGLSDDLTLMLNGEIGAGDGYGGRPLPFFRNFFAGGVSSVRGFESSSLGPRDNNNEVLGGTRRIVGNAEFFFPLPGARNDRAVRLSAFMDTGNVYGKDEKLDLGELRYSAGVGLNWFSPVGPLKFTLSRPLKQRPGDIEQRFQFALGTVF
jgi:outer membrane protein insertion porin family